MLGSKEYPYKAELLTKNNIKPSFKASKKQMEFFKRNEERAKLTASKVNHSSCGLNNRLPASLKLVRFIKAKGIVTSGNIKRFEAINIIQELGFSVNENDSIEKDE